MSQPQQTDLQEKFPWKLPDIEKPVAQDRSKDALSIIIVADKGLKAFWINAAIIAIVYFVIMFLIVRMTGSWPAALSLALVPCLTYILVRTDLFWINVANQQGVLYMDYVWKGDLTFFTEGGHFTSITSKQQGDVVNFKKSILIQHTKANNDHIVRRSADDREVICELTIVARRKPEADMLGQSLRWNDKEIETLIRETVLSRLTTAIGMNCFDRIREKADEIVRWIALTFDGANMSEFEKNIGFSIENPVLTIVGVTTESNDILAARAKAGVLNSILKDFKGEVSDAKLAANLALAATGNLTQTLNTQRFEIEGDLPQGLRTIALGNAGLAIANENENHDRGNKRNRGERNQQNK